MHELLYHEAGVMFKAALCKICFMYKDMMEQGTGTKAWAGKGRLTATSVQSLQINCSTFPSVLLYHLQYVKPVPGQNDWKNIPMSLVTKEPDQMTSIKDQDLEWDLLSGIHGESEWQMS